MLKRYITENFFKVKLSQQHLAISTSGDPLEEFTIYLESVPTNSEGWIICDFNDPTKRDLIYYHSKTVSSITYYRKNRSNPIVTHKKNSYCQINDVAEFFNYLFDNVDDLGFVKDMGTNKVKILGGQCYYNKTFKTIADSAITTLADGTWYAVLDYSDDTLKCVSSVDTDTHLKFATIVVASTDISSIIDNRTIQLQSNKNVVDGLSEYGGNLLYNGVPLGGSGGTGDVIGPSNSTTDNIVTMGGPTGKVIKDSLNKFSIDGLFTGNSDNNIPTEKAIKTYVDTEINNNNANLTDATFMLGETCAVGDSLFKEVGPTFAQATTNQNIGDVAGNTRVSIMCIGSGIVGNTLKLALAKVDNAGVDLTLRIETDNAGVPSGTLVDANATSTITRASLTTSLVDTTVTLGGNITIGEGTKAHIVLSQVGDDIDGTKYFVIGYASKLPTNRYNRYFNGTNWVTKEGALSFAHGIGQADYGSTTTKRGLVLYAKKSLYINSINVVAGTGQPTKAYIEYPSGTVIETANIVSEVATFTGNTLIPAGETFALTVDNNGSSYTSRFVAGGNYAGFPRLGYNMNITGGYAQANLNSISSINSSGGEMFVYQYSGLFADSLLLKTSASKAYKLPNDIVRFAKSNGAIGEKVKCSYLGIADLFTGLTTGSPYFLQDTPGAIGTTIGTNVYIIGQAINNTKLHIENLISSGDILLTNTLGQKTTASTSYVKVIESKIQQAGYYTCIFTLTHTAVGGPTRYGRIYKNGVAYGTERSVTSSTGTVIFTENLSFGIGDYFQIYIRTDNAGYVAKLDAVKITGTPQFNKQILY